MPKRGWIYEKGDIHGEWMKKIEEGKIGREWYLLVFRKKMKFITDFLDKQKGKKILDAGCGEGILVEKYRNKGYDIEGIDPNYESEFVKPVSILKTDYKDDTFDIVLLLDVLEHISYSDQYIALKEIKRILKSDGLLIMSVPNLANLTSRIKFFLFGKLSRGDKDYNHIGERPFPEYKSLLELQNFKIEKIYGITITIPILWQIVTVFPEKLQLVHDFLLNFANIPHISLLNIFIARNIK
jgi:2-polyprenyl-3-methyl-5-hydroxy-6-metoxy-1,4-benzoquinol methylase